MQIPVLLCCFNTIFMSPNQHLLQGYGPHLLAFSLPPPLLQLLSRMQRGGKSRVRQPPPSCLVSPALPSPCNSGVTDAGEKKSSWRSTQVYVLVKISSVVSRAWGKERIRWAMAIPPAGRQQLHAYPYCHKETVILQSGTCVTVVVRRSREIKMDPADKRHLTKLKWMPLEARDVLTSGELGQSWSLLEWPHEQKRSCESPSSS